MTLKLWQNPYLNLFKFCEISDWKRVSREGDVSTIMDKELKSTVYKISGSVPAVNYIQLPKCSTQSLGLTGKNLYIFFKPTPSKYFAIHLDVATNDSLIVRVSISNLYKEFKSTSTWLQFPYLCPYPDGSIDSRTAKGGKHGYQGPAPISSRWTVLCLDLHLLLNVYLHRVFSHVKAIQLCASMSVKNCITSDISYEPGISYHDAKRKGLLSTGCTPLPRDLTFPVPSNTKWVDLYDFINFPSKEILCQPPFDSVQKCTPLMKHKHPQPVIGGSIVDTKRMDVAEVDSRQGGNQDLSLVNRLTKPKSTIRKKVTMELPEVLEDRGNNRSVNVYANTETSSSVTRNQVESHPATITRVTKLSTDQSLLPDPIMKLLHVVGYGGSNCRDILFTKDGALVIYPAHAIVVAHTLSTGKQLFLMGHTDKIAALALDPRGDILASGQAGDVTLIRLWSLRSLSCLSVLTAHARGLNCIALYKSTLWAVCRDAHDKYLVIVWDITQASHTVLARAITDVHINKLIVLSNDGFSAVSCGQSNIQLWKLRNNSLRSCPIDLLDYSVHTFTDIAHQKGDDEFLFSCTTSGLIIKLTLPHPAVDQVCKLVPTNQSGAITLERVGVTDAFCVTCSTDGYLRVWPLDFSSVFLEVDLEEPFDSVYVCDDGLKIAVGTRGGDVGVLDIDSRSYKALIHSQVDELIDFSLDYSNMQLITASSDSTIRLRAIDDHCTQIAKVKLSNFPNSFPEKVAIHPSNGTLAVGDSSGVVHIYIQQMQKQFMKFKTTKSEITGLAFSNNGYYLYVGGKCSTICVVATRDWIIARKLDGLVCRTASNCLAVNGDSTQLAVIGPSSSIVTLLNGKTLDEFLRIDVSSVCESRHLDRVVNLIYPPNYSSHLLVITSSSKLLKINNHNGEILDVVSIEDHVYSIAVSPDSQFIALGGNKMIKLYSYWSKAGGHQQFIGHSGKIKNMEFSPDGKYLISGGDGLLVWRFSGRAVLDGGDSLDVNSNVPKQTRNIIECNGTGNGNVEIPNKLFTEVLRVNGDNISPPWDFVSNGQTDCIDNQGDGFINNPTAIRLPKFYSRLHNQEVPEDGRVTFSVRIKSHPPLRTRWFHDGVVVKNDGRVVISFDGTMHSLDISRIRIPDAGTWTCIAENRAGKITSYANLKVIPTANVGNIGGHSIQSGLLTPPNFVNALVSLKAKVGEGIRLDAIIECDPDPEVEWFHNERIIYDSVRIKKIFVGAKFSLVISDIRLSDAGKYSIVARNSCGRSVSTAELSVADELSGEPMGDADTMLAFGSTSPTIYDLNESHTPPPVTGLIMDRQTERDVENVGLTEPSVQRFAAVHKRFLSRERCFPVAQCRYVAPPNQSGLKLTTVIGYNGNGRSNLAWNADADSSLVIYTSGAIVIVEDLTTNEQTHLIGHDHEINTLSLSNASQFLATASSSDGLSNCQLCIWSLPNRLIKIITYYKTGVQSLAFSKDDSYLISAGDLHSPAVALWSTADWSLLTACVPETPVLQISWDPSAFTEFVTIGYDRCISFWMLELGEGVRLGVHRACVPGEVVGELTSVCYGPDSSLYAGTSRGTLSAWDTRDNSCYMHWEGDTAEIGVLVCRSRRLVMGSSAGRLRLWSIREERQGRQQLVMEDEMVLDGGVISASFDSSLDMGIVGTDASTLWYINWDERSSIRLVSSHSLSVTGVALNNERYLATSCADGSVRLWTLDGSAVEQSMQFQVAGQSCGCVAFSPETTPLNKLKVIAGYLDGTLRLFDLTKMDVTLKMRPHSSSVEHVIYSRDERVFISGGADGLIAVNNTATGMTLRIISDHKGASITDLHAQPSTNRDPMVAPPSLWLVCSQDRRVSVWSSDWSRDLCDLIDWLTFPALSGSTDPSSNPPSLARFSPTDTDVIVYSGYGLQCCIQFYSLSQRKTIRKLDINHWAASLDVSPKGHVIAIATREWLLKLVDYTEGTFQDFLTHSDSLSKVIFSPRGNIIFSVAHNEIHMHKLLV